MHTVQSHQAHVLALDDAILQANNGIPVPVEASVSIDAEQLWSLTHVAIIFRSIESTFLSRVSTFWFNYPNEANTASILWISP